MIEKIKTYLAYIGVPFMFLLGVIYFLIFKNNKLEDELQGEKYNGTNKETKAKQEAADQEASAAIAHYESMRDAYLRDRVRSGDPGVRSGDKGTDKAD